MGMAPDVTDVAIPIIAGTITQCHRQITYISSAHLFCLPLNAHGVGSLKGFHLFWEGFPDALERLMGACQYLFCIRKG